MKTLEISTRCGQDSDCNPSNALAVLGVINGFSKLPVYMQEGIRAVADSTFINTTYTFNKAVESTYNYAIGFIKDAGGSVKSKKISIKTQVPLPPKEEVSFPDVVFDKKISVFGKDGFTFLGTWEKLSTTAGRGKKSRDLGLYSSVKGDELTLRFIGTGVSLTGNWVKDGGKADVYIDGKLHRTIDTYYFFARQQHPDVSLWHVFDLDQGEHEVKLVVKGEKRSESEDARVYITGATIFKTASKKNENFRFSFEKE